MAGEAPRPAAAIGAAGSSMHAHTSPPSPWPTHPHATQHDSLAAKRLEKLCSAASSPEIGAVKYPSGLQDERRS